MIRLAIARCALLLLLPQQTPLQRHFRPGEVERFRVVLVVRSEGHGQRAEKIGSRAYATPFSISSEETLTWQVIRRVVTVHDDGSAQMEETLEQFSSWEDPPAEARSDEKTETDEALRLALLAWSRPRRLTVRYRESPRGEIRSLGAEAGPVLDEGPPVLTLWLRRALRPCAALRGSLGGVETHWNEPRTVALPPWKEPRGTESGTWLTGPFPQLPMVRFDNLHVTQHITAAVPSVEGVAGEGQARFHAESVATVVAAGASSHGEHGSLMQAVRSASREVSHTLAPVPGLAAAPRFSNRISVEILITRADYPPL